MRAEVKEMEEGNKTPASKRNAPGTGEQYLRALLKCADWVSAPYKQLAEKNRENPEVLKELYLCACDGVPIEAATEGAGEKPAPGGAAFPAVKAS